MSVKSMVLSVLKKQKAPISIGTTQRELYAQYGKNYSFVYVKSVLFELLANNKVVFKDAGTKGMLFSIRDRTTNWKQEVKT